jgi:hypothetical protein
MRTAEDYSVIDPAARQAHLARKTDSKMASAIFQIGRFLRRSIPFYDEHPIDLYYLIRAPYLVRMKSEET